jgi:hypothetical protein
MCGLITFQAPRAKGIFTAITITVTVFSFFSIASEGAAAAIRFLGVDQISGIFTSAAYLFGANYKPIPTVW